MATKKPYTEGKETKGEAKMDKKMGMTESMEKRMGMSKPPAKSKKK